MNLVTLLNNLSVILLNVYIRTVKTEYCADMKTVDILRNYVKIEYCTDMKTVDILRNYGLF